MSERESLWEFLPKWYRGWLLLLFLWFLFVFAEWLWFHITGHPFWPVVG